MATSDVDQKLLGRLAGTTASTNALLSSSLYQLLGLSVVLSRKLLKARKLRKLDTSRDTKSLSLYHHIIWLSREGLTILEVGILPYTKDGRHGPESVVLSNKLRASFYHVFCLFNNQPPVSHLNIPSYVSSNPPAAPLSTRQDHGPSFANGNAPNSQDDASTAKQSKPKPQANLRDPIPSITSEASYLTNPYGTGGPVGTPSPSYPPGLPPGFSNLTAPQPSAFLLPSMNFLPRTSNYFTTASTLAAQLLPGSHPLRLSVALEHAAFLWDCVHEHEGARKLSRRAIREVYRATEGMDDSEFEDAAELVGVLGRMMRRSSWEGTPRTGLRSGDGATTTAPAPAPNPGGDRPVAQQQQQQLQQQNGAGGNPSSRARAASDSRFMAAPTIPSSTTAAPPVPSRDARRPRTNPDSDTSPQSAQTAVRHGGRSSSSRSADTTLAATTPRPGYLPAFSPGGVVQGPGMWDGKSDGLGEIGYFGAVDGAGTGTGSGGSLTPRPGGPVRTPDLGIRGGR